jgi:AP2 domain
MGREYLIRRYEHNHFRGWVVSIKRRGKRKVRYFSDRPAGRVAALKNARRFRDELLPRLPLPNKIKRHYILNTTGVIGVARTKERTRTGKSLVRYAACWPTTTGKPGRATFSVGLYGEAEAFRLAVAARKAGLAALTRDYRASCSTSRKAVSS